MTLGDILQKAAKDDLSGLSKGDLTYLELVKDGKFEIKLYSKTDRDAFIECSVPDKGTEEEKNYLRLYFLSMVFNAGIYAMKKKKHKKGK